MNEWVCREHRKTSTFREYMYAQCLETSHLFVVVWLFFVCFLYSQPFYIFKWPEIMLYVDWKYNLLEKLQERLPNVLSIPFFQAVSFRPIPGTAHSFRPTYHSILKDSVSSALIMSHQLQLHPVSQSHSGDQHSIHSLVFWFAIAVTGWPWIGSGEVNSVSLISEVVGV